MDLLKKLYRRRPDRRSWIHPMYEIDCARHIAYAYIACRQLSDMGYPGYLWISKKLHKLFKKLFIGRTAQDAVMKIHDVTLADKQDKLFLRLIAMHELKPDGRKPVIYIGADGNFAIGVADHVDGQ